MKLARQFYNRDTIIVAQELLGKVLVHELNGEKVSGRIVEVEAYKGLEDKAAHSYHGKKTERVAVMYGPPGYAYVFLIYGMYHCMNVVTEKKGIPEAVLIRALEPIEGLELMSQHRYDKNYTNLSTRQKLGLTNGPGKLCIALSISKDNNGQDLLGNELYIEEGSSELFVIEESKRIGIDYAQEAKDYLWRYHIKGNPYVSK